MPPKGGITKRGPFRRKVALACEPCRERKVRCNGEKPICGPCARRSYSIEHCIYKLENARSASNDEYIKALHSRIKELEAACTKAGVTAPPTLPQGTEEAESEPSVQEPLSLGMEALAADSRTSVAAQGLLGLGSIPDPSDREQTCSTSAFQDSSFPEHTIQSAQHSSHSHAREAGPNVYPSPSLNSHSNVTAMGAISDVEDGLTTDTPQEPYYGNSSAASLMRLARESMPLRSYMQALRSESNPTRGSEHDLGLWRDLARGSPGFQFDDFSLPPRSLADHLLECYWNRVHCLYPFFHRPSFEQAYENLWGSNKNPQPQLPELNIGLGSTFDSGPNSIVFHCALNAIFGLGCHFSDIPAAERELAAYSFFLRSKRFVGLDLLDIGTIGVVQTFLIMALFLQSTPYPDRCWNSIGVACRAAQGLGLHEATTQISTKPLETEIRRRTWHGCVIMDLIVSMTYGRPSMTSQISPVPFPAMGAESRSDDPCERTGQPCDHKLGYMTFYVSTIELYKILESILSDIYNAWQSRSTNTRAVAGRSTRHNSLDVIMELEDKLSAYETSVPEMINWTREHRPSNTDSHRLSIFRRQRNVLHARFIHLRLLLYRPMFTQLCSDERNGTTRRPGPENSIKTTFPRSEKNVIYSSVSAKCAAACVTAAVELVSLVYETYQTTVTDAWWYNGFYTSTAGFVLIMSCSCRSILEQIDSRTVDETWCKCEDILTHMAVFSVSARNSLQFLQATHQHIVNHYSGTFRRDDTTETHSNIEAMPREETDIREQDANNAQPSNPFMSWDELGLGSEEFGFLGRFDVPDLASWFSDIPP